MDRYVVGGGGGGGIVEKKQGANAKIENVIQIWKIYRAYSVL